MKPDYPADLSISSMPPRSAPPESVLPHWRTLEAVARFYDERKVGNVGALGFRRSTDLLVLLQCLETLVQEGWLDPGKSRFLDLGCADGRVNVLMSYLTQVSAGIELDEWTLDEYAPLKQSLEARLQEEGRPPPPRNIHLLHGDSTAPDVHDALREATGLPFEDFDLFYTYLIMHEEFGELIRRRARSGARFLVYGLSSIMPRYPGMRLLTDPRPLEGILAVYEKG